MVEDDRKRQGLSGYALRQGSGLTRPTGACQRFDPGMRNIGTGRIDGQLSTARIDDQVHVFYRHGAQQYFITDHQQGLNVEENWRFHEAMLVFCQRPPADVALVPDTLQADMGDTLNSAKAGENR